MKLKHQTFILVSVFVSILSQAPLFREKIGIETQMLMLPFWLVTFCITLYQNQCLKVSRTFVIYIQFFLIIVGSTFLEIISDNSYFFGFTKMIIMALLIFFIGAQSKNMFSDNWFRKLAYTYVMATLFLAIDIYFEYFIGYNFQVMGYIYRAKNSAGQILLTAVIFLLYLLEKRKKCFLKGLLIAFFILEIIIMRSRATILSSLFIPITFFKNSYLKLRYKILFIIFLIIVITYVLINENVYNLIINNLLLNSNENISLKKIDLNMVSSNRISTIRELPELLNGKEFCGLGFPFYVDNVFANAIGTYGLVIGILVCLLAIFPVLIIRRNYRRILFNKKNMYLQMIMLIYVFNGFFEGWAPFGPGAKCFLVWLLLGMLLSADNKDLYD